MREVVDIACLVIPVVIATEWARRKQDADRV